MVALLSLPAALPAALYPPVKISNETDAYILDNGIVTAEISKRSGDLTSLKYRNLEMLDEHGDRQAAYWSHNAARGKQAGRITIDPKTNGGKRGEVSIKGISGGAQMGSGPGGSVVADIEIRYALGRGDAGVYTYSIFSHPTNYPATSIGEARFCMKLNDGLFDWMTVDSNRNMEMITTYDWNHGTQMNFKEGRRMNTGLYQGEVEHKYDYSANQFDVRAWGWSSSAQHVGIWLVNPSVEYLSGGPTKFELSSHRDATFNTNALNAPAPPTLLNYWRGSHYGGSICNIAATDAWTKVIGPFVIYCNAGKNPDAMWHDALAKAAKEAKAWPYDWVNGVDYPHKNERATVSGKIILDDPQAPGLKMKNLLVGLTAPDYAPAVIPRGPRDGGGGGRGRGRGGRGGGTNDSVGATNTSSQIETGATNLLAHAGTNYDAGETGGYGLAGGGDDEEAMLTNQSSSISAGTNDNLNADENSTNHFELASTNHSETTGGTNSTALTGPKEVANIETNLISGSTNSAAISGGDSTNQLGRTGANLNVGSGNSSGRGGTNRLRGGGLPRIVDWQIDAKNYEFWVRADASGKFSIPNVRAGTYSLHAIADGVLGDLTVTNITVKSGKNLSLGKITWRPVRYGRQIWDIGIPNRSGAEFFKGDQYFHWGWYLQYPKLFPYDVKYVIGQSDYHKDWFFEQVPYNDNTNNTTGRGNGSETTWTVTFTLTNAPHGKATLRLPICGVGARNITVYMNDRVVGSVTNLSYNATINRDGIGGYWSEHNVVFNAASMKTGTNLLELSIPAGGLTSGIIYDYLRLELDENAAPPK